MNRGHRGGALFLEDADRRRFLGAVGELPERFGLEVHAFVLMDNHYHLLVRTGEANLSLAVRWLNVSYAIKFNWAHRCHGSVFQGRFQGVLIQEEGKAVEVARYVHLNPVRHGGMRLVEVVREVGMKYQAAAQGVKRFARALAEDPERKRFVAKLRNLLSTN